MKRPKFAITLLLWVSISLWPILNLTGLNELLPISYSDEIYKCQCPGTFEISLKEATKYDIWVYRRFRNRLGETGFLIPAIHIVNETDGREVRLLPLKQDPDLEINDLNNFGVVARTMFSFEVPKTSNYRLHCDEGCILAVVPARLSSPSPGWESLWEQHHRQCLFQWETWRLRQAVPRCIIIPVFTQR